jgi:DNA recombination protein RmuC
MTEGLIITVILLLLAVVVMLLIVLRRETNTDLCPVVSRIDTLEKSQERTERGVKEEIARNRQESTEQGRGLREEIQASLKNSTDLPVQSLDRISGPGKERLEVGGTVWGQIVPEGLGNVLIWR